MKKFLFVFVLVVLLCSGFVPLDDSIEENPVDRAWICTYPNGIEYCHGRIGDSHTTYTVTLSVPSSSPYKAIANIYLGSTATQTTGWLYAGQSATIQQGINWNGPHNWTSNCDVKPANW